MTTDHTPPAEQTVDDLRAEIEALRQQHWASLRRADQINNDLMQEVQRYAAGEERPVLWSVYNEMHKRALKAEAEAHQYCTALQGVARRDAVLPPPVSQADAGSGRQAEAELYVLLRKAGEDRYEAQALIDRHRDEVLRRDELRRMADEAQPGTVAARLPDCPSDCPCRRVCIGRDRQPAANARQDGARS